MKKIPLTQGKFALVDDADYEWLSKWKWCYHSRGYAARGQYNPVTKKITQIFMHRLIMNPLKSMIIDHVNHNGLDNRRCNLRICTREQNAYNSRSHKNSASQYKGVHWGKLTQNWRAEITCKGKRIHLGVYTNEKDAARAYDNKAIELFGVFAKPNLPRRIPRK